MRQSNVIFGTLLFMFVVYVTMRGQLPAYLDLFKAKNVNASAGASNSSASKIIDAGKAKATSTISDAFKAWLASQFGG